MQFRFVGRALLWDKQEQVLGGQQSARGGEDQAAGGAVDHGADGFSRAVGQEGGLAVGAEMGEGVGDGGLLEGGRAPRGAWGYPATPRGAWGYPRKTTAGPTRVGPAGRWLEWFARVERTGTVHKTGLESEVTGEVAVSAGSSSCPYDPSSCLSSSLPSAISCSSLGPDACRRATVGGNAIRLPAVLSERSGARLERSRTTAGRRA